MKKPMDLNLALNRFEQRYGIPSFDDSGLSKKQLFYNQYRVLKTLDPKLLKNLDLKERSDLVDAQKILEHTHLVTPLTDESKYLDKDTTVRVFSVLNMKTSQAMSYLTDSMSDVLLVSSLKYQSLEKMFKDLPDEKKFKRLFYESMNSGWDYFKNNHHWMRAVHLHSLKVDPNIIFNHLSKAIESNLSLPILSNKNWNCLKSYHGGKLNDAERLVKDFFICEFNKSDYKKLMKYLSGFYTPDRICSLTFSNGDHFFGESDVRDIIDMLKTAKEAGYDMQKLIMKQAKNLEQVHDFLEERIEEESLISKSNNFDLNQREDFLKLDNTEIKVLDQTYVVKIPKTRHDLAIFSRKSMFDNCIGKSSGYAESVRDGRSSVVGVFDKNNKPMYCIQTSKYSFLQAKGVSNSVIPKKILQALESAITVKPELPKDFIGVEHSFVFGYSYNPQSESLFVMFRKNDQIYEYTGINMDTYEEFAKTKAKGQMLNSVIKKYPCHRLSVKSKPKRIAA